MRQLIAGNWKMNGLTGEAAVLAAALRDGCEGPGGERLACDMLVCPPATQIAMVADILGETDIAVGGQDCSACARGAHTGDISADMLADAGCIAVILGHSERRADHGETSAMVRAKAEAAMRAELVPIVCVGETLDERAAGQAADVVGHQVAESLPDGFAGVVAYEPVWAIGTGQTAHVADVAAMHGHIRAALVARLGTAGAGVRILYGGSVKPESAAGLLSVAEVGGALVGGASLDAAGFLAIARACVKGG